MNRTKGLDQRIDVSPVGQATPQTWPRHSSSGQHRCPTPRKTRWRNRCLRGILRNIEQKARRMVRASQTSRTKMKKVLVQIQHIIRACVELDRHDSQTYRSCPSPTTLVSGSQSPIRRGCAQGRKSPPRVVFPSGNTCWSQRSRANH